MTNTVVSNGVISSGLTLQSGDTLSVLAGGTIHDITVSGGQIGLAGVSTSNVTIYAGATEVVSSGGVASGASGSGTKVSGGTLSILSGGALAFSTDYSGGVTSVASGGTAFNLSVSSGGTLNIAGQTQSNVQVFSSGIENVQSGGLISGTFGSGTGVAGGTLNVLAGGSAAFVTVSSGGTMNVAGTVLSNVAVVSGGIENVLSGGLISGASGSGTGVSGGTLNVSAGGTADFVGVSSGGVVNVSSGGLQQFSTDYSSGITNILSGGKANSLTVSSGGVLNVAGTTTSFMTVSNGGVENVLSGGLLSGMLFSGTGVSGGTLNVSAGGTADFVGVSGGGIVNISSGGSLEFVSDLSGGTINILSGGQADSLGVSGGTLNVAGTVLSNVGVFSGGVENVLSGGLISGNNVLGTGISGGTVNVLAGGSAAFLAVSSGGGYGTLNVSSGGQLEFSTDYGSGITNISAGGKADSLTVSSGGLLNVAGTTTSFVTVSSGGVENVLSGGLISGASGSGNVISGGTLNVSAGGTAAFVGVSSGGTANVSSGAILTSATDYSSGVINVLAGGVASHLTVSGGATLNVAGTTLSNVGVLGTENVLSGGLISGASGSGTGISAGGTVNLLAGGSAAFVGVSSGGTLNVAGVVMSNGPVYSGGVENVQSGGLISGAIGSGTGISGGTVNVLAGGSAAFVTVSSGGTMNVAGTVLSNVAVVSGGIENVLSGGLISGASGSGTGVSGGTLNVSAGGTADFVGVSSGGVVNVSSGGLQQFSTDYSSGITNILSGGKANSLTVSSGGVLNVAGTTTSFMTVSNGGVENVLSGGVANGTIISGGKLELAIGASAGSKIVFSGTGGTLRIDDSATPGATISGLTAGDVIDLAGVTFVAGGSVHLSAGNVLAVTENSVIYDLQLDPTASFAGEQFNVTADSGTGTNVNVYVDHAPVTTPVSSSVTATHGETSVAASSLFSVTDADGDTITEYGLWDTGGSGHWSINGVAQAANTEIDITAAQLAQTSYVFGGAGTPSDLLYEKANDGSLWGNWSATVTASPFADQAPVTTPVSSSVTATHGETSVAASSLFSVTDLDGDNITEYALWDTGGSGHWSINGVAQAANTEIDITAAQLAQTTYVFGGAGTPSDLLYEKANDGSLWGNWSAAVTASPFADYAPAVAASNLAAAHGQSLAASSMFTVTDADGDAITEYALWDSNTNGHWVVNGVAQAATTEIDVTAAQLANTVYESGSGTDQLYARANDGTLWGTWQGFTVTAPINQPPVATAGNAAIAAGHSVAASSLFTAVDPNGDAVTTYAFWDSNTNGHFAVNGTVEAANTEIDVTAAQLAQTTYVAGSGTDQLFVRVNDGTAWGAWQAFTAGPVAPVVAAANEAIAAGHSVAASSLFTASDPDGGMLTTYAFWDSNTNGHFAVNGVTKAANTEIDVTAAQLAQTTYVAGSGTDQLFVRVNDGTAWSGWDAFTAGPVPPTVTASNLTTAPGQSIAASNLFTASDPDGGTLTTYAFWDSNTNGHFAVNGVTKAANTEIDVTAAQLAQTTYVAGSGTDQLFVRVYNGTAWSGWQAFTAGPVPPVVGAPNAAIEAGHSVAASSLFTASDPDGGTLTTYAFWDSNNNGHFSVNGTSQAANTEIDVTAAQLAQTSYFAGSGTDQLFVRVYDGTAWSTWQAFTAGPVPPVATASNLTTAPGQSIAASNLFTASDPDGGTLSAYAFWDSNTNGHFAVNGVAQGANTEIDVTAAQLAQTTYVAGSGTDQLFVRVNDGTAWSSWQGFTATGSTPAIINTGATVELGSAYPSQVTFFGPTGTLKLDNSASFNGTVAGMTAQDTIDFADISSASIQSPSLQNGTSSGGTLHVTDGTHTANIALLGNYMASTFAASSDGHGGTLVVDPPAMASQNNLLAQAQHA